MLNDTAESPNDAINTAAPLKDKKKMTERFWQLRENGGKPDSQFMVTLIKNTTAASNKAAEHTGDSKVLLSTTDRLINRSFVAPHASVENLPCLPKTRQISAKHCSVCKCVKSVCKCAADSSVV